MHFAIWGVAFAAALLALDRLFLWLEANGWMYYRRSKPRGGAAVYHLMQIHSTFEPGFEEVIEVKVNEDQNENEAGNPPGGADTDRGQRAHPRRSP